MKDILIMSKKELERSHVMKNIEEKKISQTKAAQLLHISERHTRRLWKRYSSEGDRGLLSKKRGSPSNRRISSTIIKKLKRIISKYYQDFGPTLTQEKLEEKHQITLSVETVRKWMIEFGFWKTKKAKKPVIHQLRKRRAKEGELEQIDGSPHDWFEGRGPKCTLLVCIDDATSKLKAMQFVSSETTEGYFDLVKEYVENYGRPLAFYSDRHSIFRVNHKEALTGNGMTQFGRALKELDIKLICANTPQAKGRVERANQLLQDRLVKEMRLLNISNMKEGNRYLPKFIKKHNQRFGVAAQSEQDAHRALLSQHSLSEILVKKESRHLSKNLTFQYEKNIYQIETKRAGYAMRHAKVQVIENKGKISISYQGKNLPYTIYHQQEKQGEIVDIKNVDCFFERRKKPAKHHPWR